MLIVMFFLSWQLTLLALVTLPLFWVTTLRLGRRIRESSRKQRQREGAMATTAAEAMDAIEVIKAMGLEQRFATIFNRRNAAAKKKISRPAASPSGSADRWTSCWPFPRPSCCGSAANWRCKDK